METNPGMILQRMGVEVSPDDPRSADQILNEINRRRIENNVAMEPDPDVRAKMAEFAIRTYPLETDQVAELSLDNEQTTKPQIMLPKRKPGSPYFA